MRRLITWIRTFLRWKRFMSKVNATYDSRSIECAKAIMEYAPEILEHADFVAGGFLRDTLLGDPPKDLDAYFFTHEQMHKASNILIADGWLTSGCSKNCRNHVKKGKKLQLICFGDKKPEDVLERFDLTVCCVSLDMDDGTLYTTAEFERDLHGRVLRLNNPMFPAATEKRLQMFATRGYVLPEDTLAAMDDMLLEGREQRHGAPFNFAEYTEWCDKESLIA